MLIVLAPFLKTATLLLAATAVISFGLSAHAETWKPTDDNEVLEVLPPHMRRSIEQDELRILRQAWEKNPKNLDAASKLAQALLKQGQATTDPRFYGEIEAALAPWWNDANPPVEILRLRASVLQFNHRFDDALRDLRAYLQKMPNDTQALLIEATILQIQGKYSDALNSCSAIQDGRNRYVADVCKFASRAYVEDAEPLWKQLLVVSELGGFGASTFELSYGWSILGDVALKLNKIDEAITAYKKAISYNAADVYARASLGDVLLDLQRYNEAAEQVCSSTSHDGLQLRCARALMQIDRATSDKLTAELELSFNAQKQRQSATHSREWAYFLLYIKGDAEGALTAARSNYAEQREPIDARLLIEAAYRTKRMADANEAIQWAKSVEVKYARIADFLSGAGL